MRRLLLVRHAQSQWNLEGRWQGVADPDLSEEGRRQAAAAGTALAAMVDRRRSPGGEALGGPVVGLWSSDLRRAVDTAVALGAGVGWPSGPQIAVGLREHDVGEWSGLTHDEIERRWPGMLGRWSRDPMTGPPGAEGRDVLDARVRAAVVALAEGSPEGLTVAVTHGGVLRSVARWLGLHERPMANTEGYVLDAGSTSPAGPGPGHDPGPADSTRVTHIADVGLLPQRPPLARDRAQTGVPRH